MAVDCTGNSPITFVRDHEDDITDRYNEAQYIEIVGIACKHFLKNLCPDYDRIKRLSDARKRMDKLRQLPLYKELTRTKPKPALDITAYLLDPHCDYAKRRTKEEKNDQCRADILRGIDALSALASDTRKRRITGSVKVYLLRENPYVSYTWVRRQGRRPALFYLGFLLREIQGIDSPRLRIIGPDLRMNAFPIHRGRLQKHRKPLFRWDASGCAFDSSWQNGAKHDVFLCHNSQDKRAVAGIARQMQEKYGILPWLDDLHLKAGVRWQDEIERIVGIVNCMVVFIGPHGVGNWQALETGSFLNRAAQEGVVPIPVLLPGSKGPPAGFLSQYQWVDLRSKRDYGLETLCKEIKKANGL